LNINNHHPPLWILIYGLVIIAFGTFLLTIGSGIRVSLIFIVIGLSLIALWLYLDIRSKEKRQKKRAYVNITQVCICLICDHKETKICLQQKCACCLIMKGNDIIGHHSDNSSQ
jgi:hypothetical protein